MVRPGDSPALRKERGAFFTPTSIADFLAGWATSGGLESVVLDPTCGEAVFLLAAGRALAAMGRGPEHLREQLLGYDLHSDSLAWSEAALAGERMVATLRQADFFTVPAPGPTDPDGRVDAVIGNPPFVRYQRHTGTSRDVSKGAAARQGVELSNMASSWAAMLVHSCGFLKEDGKLAMVLPAELLTVDYAEPVRAWLKARFEQVHLVFFEKLQFQDASEKVVLILAAGSGGCDAFSLYFLEDAADLVSVRPMSGQAATVAPSGKWSALQLTNGQRTILDTVTAENFVPLTTYGAPILGSVTGANGFFLMTEDQRASRGLSEARGQVMKVCPSQSKFVGGLSYSSRSWAAARQAGERVWLFRPRVDDDSTAVRDYRLAGEHDNFHSSYKCRTRDPWWRPPVVAAPDMFFTYMSHRYPRLIVNDAGTTMLNSMHGLRLAGGVPGFARNALPLLCLNTVTLLGCEVAGRAYGNGLLKLEPREAGRMPVPDVADLEAAWELLSVEFEALDRLMLAGNAHDVIERVDEVLLHTVMGLTRSQVTALETGLDGIRRRRLSASRAKSKTQL